ncbi:hypothetical protein ACS0TY_004145 [Phlomoides rotata]
MADRRSLFSRFWPPSASRRTPPTQTITPSPAIPASPSRPTPNRHPTTTTQLATPASTPPTPNRHPITTTQPATDHQTAKQPSSTISEPRKSPSTQPKTVITSTNPTYEPKTTSPSRATTQSSPPTKPPSPNRRGGKSQLPPQPSSPSNSTPQAQHTGSQTPKIASRPRLNSPSTKAGSSSSPKRTQPKPPLKESRQPTQEISNNEKDPKLTTSQQEPQVNAEVETDRANDFNGIFLDGTSFKHDEVVLPPSQSSKISTTTTSDPRHKAPAPSKSLDSSTTNGEHEPLVESNAKPEKAEDVEEVVQATNNEANEETKKEKSFSKDQIIEKTETPSKPLSSSFEDPIIEKTTIPSEPLSFGSEDHIIEKKAIPSKADKEKREEQEPLHTNEISGNTRNVQSKIIKSTISSTHNKSDLSNVDHVLQHKNIRDNMSTFANQMANGDPKAAISDKPVTVSVITLAGENRGASMQIESSSSKSEGAIHIHRSYKINPDQSTDREECSDRKKSEDDQPTETYVNNNSQGINNSIVFNSSITDGNSGVHIQSPETRKTEFNTTRTEKLTYQPTIRRRCLKGLFLETSDSDPENPEKPRRHGCRVSCEKSDKENNTDVL